MVTPDAGVIILTAKPARPRFEFATVPCHPQQVTGEGHESREEYAEAEADGGGGSLGAS